MKVDVVFLPTDLPADLSQRAVVVFDVLRATTTMTAALAAGISNIRVFDSLDEAAAAAKAFSGPRLLGGERDCLPPPGFDLGNSPGAFSPAHCGHTLFMATTNGTRAIVAARKTSVLLAGALVNAAAVARRLRQANLDALLLCAGTRGAIAMEDVLGAGAVLDSLLSLTDARLESDAARIALRLFRASRDHLPEALADSQGGRNVRAVHLDEDIAFAAQLNSLDVVGVIQDAPLRVGLNP